MSSMAYKAEYKTTFEPRRIIQPIYTGGSVALSEEGRVLATCLGEEALLTDLNTGSQLARIEGFLVIASRSLSLRIFALRYADDEESIETKLLRTLKPHTTPVVTLATDATSSLLATGGADGGIKVWDLRGGYTTHTFHGHSGVISALHFFKVEPVVEEITSKSKKRKSRQQNERSNDTPDETTVGYRLASGGEDGNIRIWDLHKRKSIATLESHVSVVRSVEYSAEMRVLLSSSRDKTAVIWDPSDWGLKYTVPVLEGVEKAGFLQSGQFFFTGGETARLRIWRTADGAELTREQTPGSEMEAIIDVIHHIGLPFVLSVRADQTLIMHSTSPLVSLKATSSNATEPLPVIRRISGTHDEVIDLAYVGSERKLLALATNLEDIRIISLEQDASSESPYFGADKALLQGHDDIIITLSSDWSGHWLATGAKDNVAKLWRLDPDNDGYTCHATFTGHAESIGAVSLPSNAPPIGSKEYNSPLEHPPKFLITGSQDKTVKRWDISAQGGKAPRAAYTRKAHEKDINAIATSHLTPPLFASASQDRTAKIWDVEAGEAIGVLRGHKRGVWSVAFAPNNMPALTQGEGGGASSSRGMVVTGSGDKTVRIWSLADYSCLRTFEGHANSVLKVIWLPPPREKGRFKRGAQVASAAGDGLVKVWDAQTGECAATLDNHIDRVWALAVKPEPILSSAEQQKLSRSNTQEVDGVHEEDDSRTEPSLELVSGSADSTLTFWRDTTASTALAATTQATARVEQDQELQNHIRSNNYREAIVLALQLNHPKRLLELFRAVVTGAPEPGSFIGKAEVDEVLASLSDSQLWNLLRRVRDWNANARTHHIAQHILYAILRLVPKNRLLHLRRRRGGKKSADEGDVVNEELATAMAELNTATDDRSTESVKDVLDGLKAYTERHVTRAQKTSEERFVLLWALQQMSDIGGGGGGVDDRMGINGGGEDGMMMILDV
nr:putative u3 small nucleolar rna-associated protein 13 [Quercus suber]